MGRLTGSLAGISISLMSLADKYCRSRNWESRRIFGRMNRKNEVHLSSADVLLVNSRNTGIFSIHGTPENVSDANPRFSPPTTTVFPSGMVTTLPTRSIFSLRREQTWIVTAGGNLFAFKGTEFHVKFKLQMVVFVDMRSDGNDRAGLLVAAQAL